LVWPKTLTMPTEHSQLREAYEAYRARGFPSITSDRDAEDLWVELEQYAAHTCGLVERVLAGQRHLPSPLELEPQLRARMNELRARASPDIVARLDEYLEVLDAIENLAGLARIGR